MLRRLCLTGIIICLAGTSAQAIDPKYLPADTEMVLTVNVKQLLASELVKSQKRVDQLRAGFHENIPGGEEALKHLQQMGFDPLKDLHTVTLAMPPSKDPEAAFIVIEGKFNPAKVKSAAEAAARENAGILKITQEGNYTIYEVSPPGDKSHFLSLANDTTMIICSTKQTLLDSLGRNAKSPALKKEILDLLATTNPKQSLSFVATGSALVKLTEDVPLPVPNAEAALKGITGIVAAVTVEKSLKFQLGVGVGDAQTAKKMADAATGGLFMVSQLVLQKAMETPELAPLNEIMKTLKLSSKGSAVLLRGEITAEVLSKLPELKKYIPIP